MIKTIIFDYDGTLHDSSKIYCIAFRKVQHHFVKLGYIEYKSYSDEDISKWLGLPPKEMWDEFAPSLYDELKESGSIMLGQAMSDLIAEAKLYDGVIEMLSHLSKKLNLVFLSNCKRNYMKQHIKRFNLDKYFHDFYCAQDFGYAPKYEIFKEIKNKFQGQYLVVGDRYKDIEISRYHDVYTIGCTYGYGSDELSQADFTVNSIEELKSTILQLISNSF